MWFARTTLTAVVTALSVGYANAQRFFLAVAAGALLMSVIAAPATASPLVSWRFINGLVDTTNPAHGVEPAGRPWTTITGNATIDLGAQTVQFQVTGLTLASGDAIGTTGNVTQVSGLISCPIQGGFSFATTPTVALNPQGDATFSGTFLNPPSLTCTPSNVAFFIVIHTPPSAVTPYIAFGSSRFTR